MSDSPRPSPDLTHALDVFRSVVGPENVIVDDEPRRAAETATFLTSQKVYAIVRPRDREQVQACVRAAAASKVPIYPVSRGKNWGYGSRVPPQDSVIVDLSRLDRILEHDERLGYVTIEPGVTFAQLDAYLRERGSRLRVNFTGGSREGSVVGNALERGIGMASGADRAAQVCALEVVLANGQCVHTGFSHYPGARCANLRRAGLGPELDALFFQSNFGIVTKLTQWLAPAAEAADIMEATIQTRWELPRFIDALQPLCLSGALHGTIKIVNDYRLIGSKTQYPWEALGGERPMKPSAFRGAGVAPTWLAMTMIDLPAPSFRTPTRDLLRAKVGGRASVRFQEVDPLAFPDSRDVEGTYWRKKQKPPPSPDPDRDRCGVIFICPILPFVGRDVARAVRIVERAMLGHGFEPFITLTAIDGRSLHMVAILMFDRDEPGEDEKALTASRNIASTLIAAGYYPYRLPIHFHDVLPEPADDFQRTVDALKGVFDPARVLAPGRYE